MDFCGFTVSSLLESFCVILLRFRAKEGYQIKGKSSLYNVIYIAFWWEMSSLRVTEENVSLKCIFLDFGENPSSTFRFICAKTIVFRPKRYRAVFVRNWFFILLVPIPFICTMHRFGEKTVNMGKGTLRRGFPPKRGFAPIWRRRTL